MLKLSAPQKTDEQLLRIAASGTRVLARKAQAELRERMNALMRAELAKRAEGSR